MRLKNYLNELSMKSKTQLDVKQGNDYVDATIITTDGERFELTIDKGSWYYHPFVEKYNREMDEWEIVFTDETGSIKRVKKSPKIAIELFAAIEKVVTDFIKKYKPEAIRFTGTGDKEKLYRLLGKKIEKSGKYFDIDQEYGLLFQLVRKDILKSVGWKI